MKRRTLITIVLLLTWGILNGSDKPLIAQTVGTVTTQPAAATAIPDDKPRLIFIAIDSLNPAYLDMDSKASGKGSEGNWLMPNVRSFLTEATFWSNARAHLPYATDMNHLNIVAGTNSGLTGVIGVFQQVVGWGLGGAVLDNTSVASARYPDGTPVETLFRFYRNAGHKSAYISNKGWVAEMYYPEDIDVLVNGKNHPDYVPQPTYANWYDNPASDRNWYCDPESIKQTLRLTWMSKSDPAEHPRDSWIADAALAVLQREQPTMTYILLGDLDHGQHFLGSVGNPEEWIAGTYSPPPGCPVRPEYLLVSRRNPNIYKAPVLDLIRDVDLAFGKLLAGLKAQGLFENSIIVLVSDHNMVNLLYREGIKKDTDLVQFLADKGLAPTNHFYSYGAGSIASLYWRPLYKEVHPYVVARAKMELLSPAHWSVNPETNALELPWMILDRKDMMEGRLDLGIDPYEIYNPYFVAQGIWPDLVVLMKNGWSIPSGGYNFGQTRGIPFNASHGSIDTANVVIAVHGLGSYAAGTRCNDPARLADVGVTLAEHLGFAFPYRAGKTLTCSEILD